MTIKAADRWVRRHHRHLKRDVRGMFAIGCERTSDGELVGAVICGRPKARAIDDGRTLEVTRLAVIEGARNACSWLLGRVRRIAGAAGFRRVRTYTLPGESGVSLRAAGWRELGTTDGGEWSSASRPREAAEFAGPKRRWEMDLFGGVP